LVDDVRLVALDLPFAFTEADDLSFFFAPAGVGAAARAPVSARGRTAWRSRNEG
jgi:hypothetical protein